MTEFTTEEKKEALKALIDQEIMLLHDWIDGRKSSNIRKEVVDEIIKKCNLKIEAFQKLRTVL